MTAPAGDEGLVPDTKDWTWTLRRPCADCGFDASGVAPEAVAAGVRAATAAWPEVLQRPGATERPDPATWSPLEYACHVRDVCRLFERRMTLMLAEDDPLFENWDQDATAVRDRYGEQPPATVASQVLEAADGLATAYGAVRPGQWDRPGRRSDGSTFTVLTLGRYGLHDLVHHLWDVAAPTPAVGGAVDG